MICSGKGHTAKHHSATEAENAARTSIGGAASSGASRVAPPRGTATSRGPKVVGRGTAVGPGAAWKPKPKGGARGGRGAGRMKPLYRMRKKTREPGRVTEEGEEDDEDDVEQVGYVMESDEEEADAGQDQGAYD